MARFNLVEGIYTYPTPGGAYIAVSSPDADASHRLIRNLLKQRFTQLLTAANAMEWSGIDDEQQALQLVHRAQELDWIQGLEQPRECPSRPLEEILPDLLSPLSGGGKVLLADSQGFYLASSGFPHEVAEELSALSAQVADLHERSSGVLMSNLGLGSSAWSVVDAVGASKLGFWPLYVGPQRFVLVISGIPKLNQPDFVDLVWTLCMRYA